MRIPGFLLALAAFAAACSAPVRPPEPCDGVICEAGKVCDPASGKCRADDACQGACAGDTPVCDAATATCVSCTATTGCSGATPVCDLAVPKGKCVACTAETGCSGATPVCDTSVAGGKCVACTPTSGCGGETPLCDTSVPGGRCITCTATEGCAGAAPLCDTSVPGGRCVTCTATSGCGGETPVCDLTVSGGKCVTCTATAGCSGEAGVCDTSVEHGRCVRCTATEGCHGRLGVCDTAFTGGQCVECLGAADCGGSAPACDPATHACVACIDDSTCPAAAPVCDTATKTCARCTTARGCTAPRPACDVSIPGGTCVGCLDASHCGGTTPVCDTSTARCVGCVGDDDCHGGVCDPTSLRCVTCLPSGHGCGGSAPVCDSSAPGGRCVQCTSSANCGGSTPVCDPTSNTCVSCLADGDCRAPFGVCDTARKACVRCTASKGCSGATGVCDLTAPAGECVGCTSNAQCAAPTAVCKPVQRSCVQCTSDAQCGGSKPVCDLGSNTCVTCNAQKGCSGATGVCDTAVAGGRCVQCLSNASCAAPAGLCDPSTASCVGCLSDANCANPTPLCGTNKACRACTANAECGAGKYCGAGSCLTIPDTCETAALLTVPASGTLTFQADTSLAADQLDGSCNAAARGVELVYRLNLATAADVQVTAARAANSAANPVLYARGPGCASGLELGCRDTSGSAGATESLTLMNRVGDVFLVIESYGATSGLVDVTVQLLPATVPPQNDECVSATALTFTGTSAHATGNTALATNSNTGPGFSTSPTCSSTAATSGRDVVYSFTLNETRDVLVDVTPSTLSADWNPVVYVRRACTSEATSDEVACHSWLNDHATALDLRNLAAGTYFVWIDGALDTVGRYDLTVTTAPPTPPPANESCATPAVLTFNNDSAAAVGDTYLAANDNASGDAAPTCSSTARSSGRDTVYRFTLTAPHDVIARVTPLTTSSYRPVVYLRPFAQCASGAATNEIACAAASSNAVVETRAYALPAGDYALWVDGDNSDAVGGRYGLDVLLLAPTPPPANDTCAAPGALAFDADGRATVSATNALASNSSVVGDTSPTCSQGARDSGKDLVYEYALQSATDVRISISPLAGSALRPVVYVRNAGACAVGTSEIVCQPTTTSGPVLANAYVSQPPGSYSVWVDGSTSATGSFRLDVQRGAPPNDVCAGAKPLQLGTAITDTTAVATNDFSKTTNPAYASACQTYSNDGRELVYAFTAPATTSYTATVTPMTGFDVALMRLEGTCSPASCVATRDAGAGGTAESLTFNAVQGTTYWFVVEGYTASQNGVFTLKIQ